MTEELKKIKEYVFDKGLRLLCDNCFWCALKDGYCPRYDCGSLDRLNAFTDRQWNNAIKKVKKYYSKTSLSFDDLVEEVLHELRYNRPRGKAI